MTPGYWLGIPYSALPLHWWQRGMATLRRDAPKERSAEALWNAITLGADLYCSAIWLLRGFHSMAAPYRQAREFPIGSKPLAIEPDRLDLGDGVAFQFGRTDFDLPERQMSATYRAVYWVLRNAPLPRFDHVPLPPLPEYQGIITRLLAETFKAYRPLDIDPDAAEMPVLYVTHDIAASTLRKQGDRYVVDLSEHESLPLKYGDEVYERYGGKLSFDREHKDVSIEYRGETFRPGDPGWPRARYVFVSTAFISTIIQQHTVHCHLVNSALFALKTRLLLDGDHPLYRFLRPFTLKSVAINEHAYYTIISESGVVNHGTAYHYDALKTLYKLAWNQYRHVPIRQQYAEQGFTTEPDDGARDFPYIYESTRLYEIIDGFVERYLALYWPDEQALARDSALARWHREIVEGLPKTCGVSPVLTLASLRDLLAVFVWNVTFFHDLTSQSGNTAWDYRLGAVLVRKSETSGSMYPGMQEQFVTLLTHQLTTVESVKVLDNFHCFWLDERATSAAMRFQEDLLAYRRQLIERDRERSVSYQLTDPLNIETSVQT